MSESDHARTCGEARSHIGACITFCWLISDYRRLPRVGVEGKIPKCPLVIEVSERKSGGGLIYISMSKGQKGKQ